MLNCTVKHIIRRITLCVLAVLVMGGCFNQWEGNATTITVQLNSGAGRAAYPYDEETLARLIFTVDFSGQSTFTVGPTAPGTRTISVSVPPGQYVITATAFLDDEVYATGSSSAQARAGQPTSVTLILYFARNYIVTFDSDGGGDVPLQQVNNGGVVTRPKNPAKNGFVFDDWYSDENCTVKYNFTAPVTGDIILYAKWNAIINIAGIEGVTAPATDGTPVTSIKGNEQYTGTVTWKTSSGANHTGVFAASTVYTATITLTAKTGYTLQGVAANFFTVEDAISSRNYANSGVVTVVFPTTAGTPRDPVKIDIAAIKGVTVPVTGGIPVSSITETAQYTGAVTWAPPGDLTFNFGIWYTATITITPKAGFTLQGVAADFFTVEGAESVSNSADSGVVTVTFAETVTLINTAAIEGVTVPVTGRTPVSSTSIIETEQYTGTLSWVPAVTRTFASATQYTANITITPKDGYTLQGVTANFFTVAGASSSNSANSGVITAVFPKTNTTIGIANISGVTAPKADGIPVANIIENPQYTGTVSWDGNPSVFENYNVYTATITLTPKPGYTLNGVTANFFTVAGASSSNSANSGVIRVSFPLIPYALGGTGPGGGKIFYYNEAGFTMTDTGEICHYLEAAPYDMPTDLAWASPAHTSTNIVGTGTGIGAGRKNTALILATDPDAPAAKACYEYSRNEKTDWFLPSLNELTELFNNRSLAGNMGKGFYFSSSQNSSSSGSVWIVLFQQIGDSVLRSTNKGDDNNSVRTIRAF